jgi:Mitochondrial ribosomal protein L37
MWWYVFVLAGRDPNKVLSAEVCTGANIFTDGQDPTLKPDEEYPEWLWELSKPMKSIKQIRQQVCHHPRSPCMKKCDVDEPMSTNSTACFSQGNSCRFCVLVCAVLVLGCHSGLLFLSCCCATNHNMSLETHTFSGYVSAVCDETTVLPSLYAFVGCCTSDSCTTAQ